MCVCKREREKAFYRLTEILFNLSCRLGINSLYFNAWKMKGKNKILKRLWGCALQNQKCEKEKESGFLLKGENNILPEQRSICGLHFVQTPGDLPSFGLTLQDIEVLNLLRNVPDKRLKIGSELQLY